MNRILAGCLSLFLIFPSSYATAQTEDAPPSVVVSTRPIHSIAAAVMGSAGSPELLISGAASPHAYSLRPSEARMLEKAGVVFWIGPELETFLEGPLASLASEARTYALTGASGLALLPVREGGLWEAHEDEAHEEHGAIDPHLWLDPLNGAAIAREVAEVLADADPARAAQYRENAEAFAERLDVLDREIMDRLAPARDREYIVFHDAYQYFEMRYGLSPAGSVTVAADRPAGTRRIVEIRNRIRNTDVACIFSAPQFPPRLVDTLTENAAIRRGALDDIGTELEPGPGLYEALLAHLADDFLACLVP